MAVQQLPINISNTSTIVSTVNTTTTLLGAGQTWTGGFENTTQWIQGDVASFSDVPGTLYLDLSNDGVTVIASPSFVSTGNVALKTPFNFQYVRLRYTNGATAQSSFSLQTVWRPVFSGNAVVPLNSSIFQQSTGELVRAVLESENSLSLGTFQHLQSKNSRLLVDTGSTLELANDDKLFTTSAEISSVSTVELPVLLFKNPSGSGKTVKVYRIITSNFHTVSSIIKYRLYKSPTITSNGTGLTEVSTHIGSSAVASSTLFSSPVLSANGTKMAHWLSAAMSTSALVVPFEGELIVDAGTSFAITAQADGTSRIAAITIVWAEV